jgi:hypothetical protein
MYRYSLGCTSIWLIVPMSASLCCSMSITRILLCVLIGITCFVSTSCWPYVETESLHYKVDCWLARTMFISLCLFHSLDSGRAQLPHCQSPLPSLWLSFFCTALAWLNRVQFQWVCGDTFASGIWASGGRIWHLSQLTFQLMVVLYRSVLPLACTLGISSTLMPGSLGLLSEKNLLHVSTMREVLGGA